MIGFKGFDSNLVCAPQSDRAFQYEAGQTYETNVAAICECGFHFCANAFNVIKHYKLYNSRFCEISADTKDVIAGGDKSVTTKITIVKELSICEFIQECVNELAELGCADDCAAIGSEHYKARIVGVKCHGAKISSIGEDVVLGLNGDRGKIAVSGGYARIFTMGQYTKIASSGASAQMGVTGNNTTVISSGANARIVSDGDCLDIGSSGDWAKICTIGCCNKIVSSGKYAFVDCKGADSVATAIGQSSRVKAAKGCQIVMAEYNLKGELIAIKSAKVDGERLREDTYYRLQGGEFVPIA